MGPMCLRSWASCNSWCSSPGSHGSHGHHRPHGAAWSVWIKIHCRMWMSWPRHEVIMKSTVFPCISIVISVMIYLSNLFIRATCFNRPRLWTLQHHLTQSLTYLTRKSSIPAVCWAWGVCPRTALFSEGYTWPSVIPNLRGVSKMRTLENLPFVWWLFFEDTRVYTWGPGNSSLGCCEIIFGLCGNPAKVCVVVEGYPFARPQSDAWLGFNFKIFKAQVGRMNGLLF